MVLDNKREISCSEMRKDIIRMTYNTGNTGAHIGGALSLVEIFAALYSYDNGINRENIKSEDRLRIVLSKGHGVMAQYAAMKQVGLLSDEMLMTFKKPKSVLFAHPHINGELGIEFSSGSLGQGLSQGVGVALALKRKHNHSNVFVVVGDGECDEGSIWEAAMSASHYHLNNLCVIVDKNDIQYDGKTATVMNLAMLGNKWESFGWTVITVDGHSVSQLLQAMNKVVEGPKAIIAQTVKGKGVSFMENEPKWHNGRMTEEQYELAMAEQE